MNSEILLKCFYINDYFPDMAFSWYWGLTIVCRSMGNKFYKQIMMTNTDIDIGGIVNHHYLDFLFITIYGWFRVQKMRQNGATHLSTDCCFGEVAIYKFNSTYWSSHLIEQQLFMIGLDICSCCDKQQSQSRIIPLCDLYIYFIPLLCPGVKSFKYMFWRKRTIPIVNFNH